MFFLFDIDSQSTLQSNEAHPSLSGVGINNSLKNKLVHSIFSMGYAYV